MIGTIALRELRGLYLSPLAWTVAAVLVFIAAWLFAARLEWLQDALPRLAALERGPGLTALLVPDLFGSMAITTLLVVPLLTMRTIAEERRNRTLPLLLSSPIRMTDIVLGKFLGVYGFLVMVQALVALMPMALGIGGGLDGGHLVASLVGLALLLATATATGLFFSSLTQYPAVAAVTTFGFLLMLWVLDWSGNGEGILAGLSLFNHYRPMLEGVLDTSDIAYHLILTVALLTLATRRLDAERAGA